MAQMAADEDHSNLLICEHLRNLRLIFFAGEAEVCSY
jgi:hypothetical protein